MDMAASLKVVMNEIKTGRDIKLSMIRGNKDFIT